MLERLHQQLKAALMSHATHEHWVDNLSIVLLGIRSSLKPDVNACAAALACGSTIRLPREFVEQTTPPAPGDVNDLLRRHHQFVRSQQPQPPCLSNAPSFLDPYLKTCSHVFLRCDRVHRSVNFPLMGRAKCFHEVTRLSKSSYIYVRRQSP